MTPYSVCFGESGQRYLQGQVWYPTKLQKCECITGGVVVCKNISGCLNSQNNVRPPRDKWLLEDQRTVCRCNLRSKRRCKLRPYIVCLDNRNKERVNGSRWFLSNCSSCVCEEGGILCTQHEIQAFYGHFVVTRFKPCFLNSSVSTCVTNNETSRDCKGK